MFLIDDRIVGQNSVLFSQAFSIIQSIEGYVNQSVFVRQKNNFIFDLDVSTTSARH